MPEAIFQLLGIVLLRYSKSFDADIEFERVAPIILFSLLWCAIDLSCIFFARQVANLLFRKDREPELSVVDSEHIVEGGFVVLGAVFIALGGLNLAKELVTWAATPAYGNSIQRIPGNEMFSWLLTTGIKQLHPLMMMLLGMAFLFGRTRLIDLWRHLRAIT